MTANISTDSICSDNGDATEFYDREVFTDVWKGRLDKTNFAKVPTNRRMCEEEGATRNLKLMPEERCRDEFKLVATDDGGSSNYYMLRNDRRLPFGKLSGDYCLRFNYQSSTVAAELCLKRKEEHKFA